MKCPKCGSNKTQLSSVSSKHGCLWFILFGWIWVMWIMLKWCIGFSILVCWDWWMAIIKASQKKGYVWQGLRWFSSTKKVYYCHDCGHNYRV